MQLFPLFIEVDPIHMAGARHFALSHAADENVVLPVWKLVAGVEGHAGNRDRGNPENSRLLHPFLPRFVADAWTEIETTEADQRPAVIFPRLQNVDLVTAIRPVLAFPDRAGIRLKSESQRIAMPHRVDLRTITGAADKRIIGRNRAVIPQAQHFAREVVRILRSRGSRRIADADRHVHHSVSSEDDPRSVA